MWATKWNEVLLLRYETMDRLQFIQDLIDKNNYESYLEIGIYQGKVFDNIRCKWRTGVDPDLSHYEWPYRDSIENMTSDEFFDSTLIRKYDCVFIDWLHLWEQVVRDVDNALERLEEWGIIVLHDTNPPWHDRCQREWILTWWTWDVYKAVIHFRMRDDLTVKTYPLETGITTIQKIPTDKPLWYEFLDKDRDYLLGMQ